MLRLIGEAAAAANRRVHMHLLETRYQRAWADKTFPQGIVRYLDEIGLLNEQISLAHCIYLRPDEMELIAARGATIVINTSSNFIVSSGLAPVGEMLARGCRIAMGLDGLAFDEDEDALREMRLAYAVHKAHGFDIRLPREDLLRFAFEHGRHVITGSTDGGRVAPGAPADLLLLDWDALAAELVEPDVPPLHLLLAKATRRHVEGLFVRGREIVRDGALSTVDLPALEAELLAALRRAAPTTADIRTAMPQLGAALAAHYGNAFYCG
jgi:cytosine/adenosine deaminase-related metal-dependent hydrolase